ncbi:MAG: inorganic phosphate transporter [Alphaproteobacteria bacterium]|jgi:inorganic phosphate transporter, PiT family|nr:inorganic phosphate transporter [Alphaproteobacteria bacterium]
MAQTKQSLDKDLEKIVHVEAAARSVSGGVRSHGIAVVFLVLVALLAAAFAGVSGDGVMVVLAAILGGYMAINIGANDVANNVGPAVGSRAMTLVGALVIAAIFESAGALLAGGEVVNTISKGIIDPSLVKDSGVFILAMMAALVSAALWVNLATFIGAPVSTTHAVVGGVMGAGIAAVGFQLVNWGTMSAIAASWVISPVLGGVIAALFLAFIKVNIIYQPDKIAAARRWVPMLVAIMAGAFACYLSIKGLKRIWKPDTFTILLIGAVVFSLVWVVMRPLIRRQSEGMENRNQSLRILFRIPLICSAALLSFAHGANDVANAIGPLAAILRAVEFGDIAGKVAVPAWIMMIGAFGISLGLFLYGPKLIRMVGDQITKMNPMRAYCVALSAAITVIIASWLGLPVSSTHIAVGAVFGVGFFREYYTRRSKRRRDMIAGTNADKADDATPVAPEILRHRKLVRRSHFLTIIAAWVITVPATALLSAAVFFVLSAVV